MKPDVAMVSPSTSITAGLAPDGKMDLRQGIVSVLLGIGFTWLLFFGIAHFDQAAPSEAPADFMDLKVVSLQEPPPPPREVPPEPLVAETILTGFEAAPSDSPVQIAVTPPDLEDMLPPPPVAPPAVIQVGLLYTNFKPKLDIAAPADHIYQAAEVDQIPRALNQAIPHIPSRVRDNATQLRCTLLFVVNVDGEIKNVRVAGSSGNPDFDAIIAANILEWTFSPAVRKGVKVRCLVQKAIVVKWSDVGRFQL